MSLKVTPAGVFAVVGVGAALLAYRAISNASMDLSRDGNLVDQTVENITGGIVDLHGIGTSLGGSIYKLLNKSYDPNGN